MPKPVALVIGASRGIGRQVALDLARNGYRVVVAAKSDKPIDPGAPFPPDPNSQQSTIRTVQKEIQQIPGGSDALAFAVDTRSPESVAELIQKTEAQAGSLDVLVYNAGAIWWSSVQNTPFKRFRLMQQVNVEGLYAAIQASLPVFERQHWQGRVIVVSPPIYSRFFRGKTAYAMGKVAMSVLVKGLAMDWKRDGKTGMAITSIWPAVAIQSAATPDPDLLPDLRKPTIYSDAILPCCGHPWKKSMAVLNWMKTSFGDKELRTFPNTMSFPDTTATDHAGRAARLDCG